MINYPLSVYTDGAARSNPGPAAAAFLIYDATRVILEQGGRFLGHQTNNEAEYATLIHALDDVQGRIERASRLPEEFSIEVCGDSSLVLNQVSGECSSSAGRQPMTSAQRGE